MIVLNIRGGIGNQMFQYAFGKSIAKKFRTDLVLDLEPLFSQPPRVGALPRTYELGIFSIKPKVTLISKIGLFINHSNSNFIKSLIKVEKSIKKIVEPLYKREIITEEEYLSNPNLTEQVLRNSYFVGQWQNEKYFKEISDEIRRDFSFKYTVHEKFVDVLRSIQNSPSVCIHVRRGDNVLNPKSIAAFGFIGVDYYKKAYAQIVRVVPNARFFVFSDDIKWCEENLTFIPNIKFVSEKDCEANPADDLQLMSNCSHFIIASSTFSWWAAWLGNKPGKVVIAPEIWFVDAERNVKYLKSIIVPGWFVVK